MCGPNFKNTLIYDDFARIWYNFKCGVCLVVNELPVCNEMSVSGLITAHGGYQFKLKTIKTVASNI